MQLRLMGATYETYTDPLTIETIEEVRVDWDGKSDLTAEDLNARECAHGNDTHEAHRLWIKRGNLCGRSSPMDRCRSKISSGSETGRH